MLPGKSGEEVLPHIKGIHVIVMSAKADLDNKVELLPGGAADYATKPFPTKEFIYNSHQKVRCKADEPGRKLLATAGYENSLKRK